MAADLIIENNIETGNKHPEGFMDTENEDTTVYRVVINHEEQYSIWPVHLEIPAGWSDVGVEGQKAECLSHIEEVWTDMRPLSLRQKMDQADEEKAEIDSEP